ncbi:MAG: hypothetical protein NUV67_04760 [archaeon]|nr:hypothetical protein [archaeon]
MAKADFDEIDLMAFTSVLLAAFLLGFIVHELVHVATISHPVRVSIYFGSNQFALGTCCLLEGEQPLLELSYAIQFIATIGWIIMNRKVFIKPAK